MKLTALPAFADNYIWMLHDDHRAAVVDPGEAQSVTHALIARGLELRSILVTHHHGDHTGGVAALRSATGAQVAGPASEAIPQPARRLRGGDRIDVLDRTFEVIDVPGHTAGHIAFYSAPCEGDDPLLLCGDTLFSAGCGRLLEGTAGQMLASLEALAALPDATLVCCGHEYTLANLAFAQAVEPANRDIAEHLAYCRDLRRRGLFTLPSTLALERRINPFLRSRTPSVIDAVGGFDAGVDHRDPVAVFGALRRWKNEFPS